MHSSAAADVRAWDFGTGAFVAPGAPGAEHFRKERFPAEMYPVRVEG